MTLAYVIVMFIFMGVLISTDIGDEPGLVFFASVLWPASLLVIFGLWLGKIIKSYE